MCDFLTVLIENLFRNHEAKSVLSSRSFIIILYGVSFVFEKLHLFLIQSTSLNVQAYIEIVRN